MPERIKERYEKSAIRELGTKLLAGAIAVGAAATAFLNSPSRAEAYPGCYGAECNGRDPVGLCDGDARTVGSIAINTETGYYAGQLDLRYSAKCKANWGRFTLASGPREVLAYFGGTPRAAHARVTSWNPGGQV